MTFIAVRKTMNFTPIKNAPSDAFADGSTNVLPRPTCLGLTVCGSKISDPESATG
jgi:hypothetical protein